MKTSYGEQDYPFGQAMLELRTEIGLTQGGLASHLGVSRRAVVAWETGNSYPKTAHLKELIALGVQQKAFSIGHEAEEVRALWNAARQKVLIDERWLSTLLLQRSSPQEDIVPSFMEETNSLVPFMARPAPGPRVDWGDALAVPTFYGREGEKAQLIQWVVQERCRIVSILGIGGIGKSALAVSLMRQLAEGIGTSRSPFEVIIFRSLRDAPSCEELLESCLQVLSPQLLGVVSANLQQRISLLLSLLCETQVLLVLDNLECLLQEGDVRGCFRSGFEEYGQLLRRVAETAHQSCLLLTSQENPSQLRLLRIKHPHVHSLRLTGLDVEACKQLFIEQELVGTEAEREHLIETYSGNPLALKIVAETIIDLFGGEIGEFLAGRTVIFGGITELLDEQFARISALEQCVLYWLAIVREPITLDELQALLVVPILRVQVLEAIEGLSRRSLIEHGKRPRSFTLQSVVLEYVTAVMIARASCEIQQHHLDLLTQYGLSLAHAKEYVRQTQERLLLSPLLTDLQCTIGRRQASHLRRAYESPGTRPRGGDRTLGEEQLLGLLDSLREKSDDVQGYGPANLIALLRLLRGHLSGLDLSRLSIRSACLQSVQMHDASLVGALIRDTSFAEAFSATWAVTISGDGTLWATSSMQGKVSVWEEKCRTLRLVWQAHTDQVVALAFSPDGRTLASGGMDDNLKLWDMTNGALLWIAWQKCPMSLAFSPDGTLLASGGLDGTVRIFDPQSGINLQTLSHPGDLFAVAFSPNGKLFASGCCDGKICLWEKQETAPASYVEILSIQTTWVTDLAFAPDGRTLGERTLGSDNSDVGGGKLTPAPQAPGTPSEVPGLESRWAYLACSADKTIWLWDVDQNRCRMVLHGHTGEVHRLAFTPNSRYLLSSSADSTLRVWEVQNGQGLHVIPGYAISLYDLDWSPDGTQLVSGSTDGLVTIWDLSGKMPPRVLHGHTWVVHGVGWSPDSRLLASCSWDTAIRLWDSVSGDCVHRIEDPSTTFQKLAWSPNGRLLAAGSLQRGVQVWDRATRSLRWVGQPFLTAFRQVAWSPDGTQLVGCADDGNVYLWRGTDGTLLQQLSGHQGRVSSVAWSPDGKRLASCSSSGGTWDLFVWDAETAERLQTFVQYPDGASALAWSRSHRSYPGKDLLITGCSDGTLCWWNVETGECVCVRAAHQGKIQSLKVSPDGRRLASCGNDGAITIWDLESTEHLQTLRHDRPYERLNITGIRGLSAAQIASLRALGAIENAEYPFLYDSVRRGTT